MNRDEYARMDAQESTGWWFVAKRRFVTSLLEHRGLTGDLFPLLDGGCGTGAALRAMAALGSNQAAGICGLDPSVDALNRARRKSNARLVCGSMERCPFAAGAFHTILLLDVLEHLDHDQAALQEAWRALAPGGRLVITVPAYPLLWSDHDVALHHRRRYRRRDLERLLSESGFETLYLGHIFASVFPLALLARIARRIFPPPSPSADIGAAPTALNRSLIELLRLESLLARKAPLPFGTSLLSLARKS
ncbi:MAG TPA: class I SAM-dependent methyltransferase [Armatimonadota bacterium]|nr:class I SAM-dependent methyltransferase [Armatimonadota bacterium]